MEILEQNEAYVVCVKPAGIPSQGEGPEAMPALLAAELRALSAQPPAHPSAGPSASPAESSAGPHGEIYPVHRLDQAVGGVMVYARTKQAAAALSRAIQEGRMEKEYLAVLTKPMAQPCGTLRDLLYHDRVKNKTYVVKRKRNGIKEAVLDYETLASGAAGTLVRVRLHTGRTHQIRVQFASRGCPLVGDGKYGGRGSAPLLWSYRLSFPDPRDGTMRTFTQTPEGTGWDGVKMGIASITEYKSDPVPSAVDSGRYNSKSPDNRRHFG